MKRKLLVAAVVVALAGCGGPDVAAPSPSPSATPELDIPRVSEPLDVTRFATDPCALIAPPARAEIGLPDTVHEPDVDASRCDLHLDGRRPDPRNHQRIVVATDRGLDDAHARCGTVEWLDCSQWTVDEVDGYPIIRANGDSEHKYGMCRLFLGVSDDARITVTDARVNLDANGPDCARAELAAARILATLRDPDVPGAGAGEDPAPGTGLTGGGGG